MVMLRAEVPFLDEWGHPKGRPRPQPGSVSRGPVSRTGGGGLWRWHDHAAAPVSRLGLPFCVRLALEVRCTDPEEGRWEAEPWFQPPASRTCCRGATSGPQMGRAITEGSSLGQGQGQGQGSLNLSCQGSDGK